MSIKYKTETAYQIRPKLPRAVTSHAEMTLTESTQGRNDSGPRRLCAETTCERTAELSQKYTCVSRPTLFFMPTLQFYCLPEKKFIPTDPKIFQKIRQKN